MNLKSSGFGKFELSPMLHCIVYSCSLIKGREEDGFPEIQDRLIRQALKDFPYIESQLLQSMVHQLAKTKIVSIRVV